MPIDSEAQPVFRRATVEEAPAILRVLDSAFDHWPAFQIDVPAIEHLRWKMMPAGYAQDLHGVIDRGGEIVGAQLRWLGRVEIQGRVLPLDFGTDLSVHESARGLGLGSLLRDAEEPRLFGQRIVGFDTVSANQQVADMYNVRGPIRRPTAVWARPLTARMFGSLHRDHLLSGAASATIAAVRRVARPWSPIDSPPPAVEVEPVTAFDARADALWERVRGDFELARVRHAEWLNWRYLDPRAGLIRAYQVTDGDRLLGYAAFRRDQRNGKVLDLVTEPARPAVAVALLERGVADLRRGGCVIVDCLLPARHRHESALQAAGFSRRPADRAVQITRARSQAVPEIIEVFSDEQLPIHVMYGDFDHG